MKGIRIWNYQKIKLGVTFAKGSLVSVTTLNHVKIVKRCILIVYVNKGVTNESDVVQALF